MFDTPRAVSIAIAVVFVLRHLQWVARENQGELVLQQERAYATSVLGF